jgi:hypothetical protein
MKKVYIVHEKAKYIGDNIRNLDNIVGVFETREAAQKRLTERYNALLKAVADNETETDYVELRDYENARVKVCEHDVHTETWSWRIEGQTLEQENDVAPVKIAEEQKKSLHPVQLEAIISKIVYVEANSLVEALKVVAKNREAYKQEFLKGLHQVTPQYRVTFVNS